MNHLKDTAGCERFRSVTPMYYRGSHAAVVVYDIQNLQSFESAKKWARELWRNVSLARTVQILSPSKSFQVSPEVVVVMAGNKVDLANHRKVAYKSAKDFADKNGMIFMETSAKDSINITAIFLSLGKEMYGESLSLK